MKYSRLIGHDYVNRLVVKLNIVTFHSHNTAQERRSGVESCSQQHFV